MCDVQEAQGKTPVLLIEDDEAQCKTLADILALENLHPICCRTGHEALAARKQHACQVAILDLQLPDMDGLQLLHQLLQQDPGLKIIINTAYASLESAMAAVNQGAFAYVRKLGNVEELLAHIHRALHVHLVAYSAALEAEIQKRTAALFQANKALHKEITERQRLEREILEVIGREQQRLGQELHDDLGQSLTGMGFLAEGLMKKLEAQSLPEAARMARLVDLINQTNQKTRQLAQLFYPMELERNGLGDALQILATNMETLHGISCRVMGKILLHLPDQDVSMHLYRIAQEAVNNAIRHGKARQIAIRLTSEPDHIRLTVHDDGVGIPDVVEPGRGMGLRIMHHRASMIGATLEVQRAAQGGTRVICTLPGPTVSPSRRKQA